MKTFLLPLLAAATTPPEPASAAEICTPLPGAQMLRYTIRPDFIIMGEAHGTAELPAAFADLICAFAAKREPLTVGLEFLPAEQSALDAYLASDGGNTAKKTLLASPAWSIRDGRASQAIFDLIETLRRLKARHPDLAVVAFDHPSERPDTPATREKGMADLLLAAKQARPAAPVLALTGNGHAGKSEWTSFGPPFPAMSQLLPGDVTVAISFDVGGGEIWGCRRPDNDATEQCGPRALTARGEMGPRGLSMGSSRKGFDATISVGKAFTASPPAKAGS